MKVVINKCFGGFNISIEALKELVKRNAKCIEAISPIEYYGGSGANLRMQKEWEGAWEKDKGGYKDIGDGMMGHPHAFNILKDGLLYSFNDRRNDASRADADLVSVVETMGEKANGSCASLKVIEIPDGIQWDVDDYDGIESISEAHQQWG